MISDLFENLKVAVIAGLNIMPNMTENLKDVIIGTVAGGLILACMIFLFKRFSKATFRIFSLRDKKRTIEKGLEKYKETLEEQTLKISHPWMKEEQTFNDILVPVNFKSSDDAQTQREELEIYVKKAFRKKSSPRILILGKPGSGKTIAARVMAKLLWEMEHEKGFVPVLLTF